MAICDDFVGPSEANLSSLLKMRKLLKDSFGICYLSYFATSRSGYAALLSCNLDIVGYYLENKLYLNDPMLVHPECLMEGAVLWSTISNHSFQETIRQPLARRFNVDNGLTLIRKATHPGFEIEGFSFGTNPESKDSLTLYLNELNTLFKFCNYFKKNVPSAFRDAFSNPVNISRLKGPAFTNSQRLVTGLSPQKRAGLNLLLESSSSPSVDHKPSFAPLSKQEERCLDLFLRGKSAKRTAEILRLSRRTVEHYMDNVKIKMNCDRKADLLELFNSSNNRPIGLTTN